jgi:hypothetical protein
MRMRMAVASLVVAACSACGAQQLPPPPAPSHDLPSVALPELPPAAGTGRVIVETNGEAAHVGEVTLASVRPLCTTPCVLDLPYGAHPLLLRSTNDETRASAAEVDVGPRPKVFRHTLGERTDGGPVRPVALSILGVGLLTAVTGGILWGVSASGRTGSLRTTGEIATGAGAGAVMLSLPLLFFARPTERPGATTEWSLPQQASR